MKRILNESLLLTLVLAFVASCATMQSHWEAAKSADTVQAYEEFLKNYPNSTYRAEAVERQEQATERIRLEYTLQKDEIAYYERFKTNYPHSRYAEDIQSRLNAKIKLLKQLPEIKSVKISREEGAKKGPVDDVLLNALKDALIRDGFEVKSKDDLQFDVLLSIGEVKLFIPAGTQMEYKLNGNQMRDSKTPSLGAKVEIDVDHRNGGVLLLREVIHVMNVSSDPQDKKTLDGVATMGGKISEALISCLRKYTNVRTK
jgi:hypothetical protein